MNSNQNNSFVEYVNRSKDLNPVIDGRRYSLPVKRSGFFFYYWDMQINEEYRKEHFPWLLNFRVTLQNGYTALPEENMKELRENGTESFFYIPLYGFYDFDAYKQQIDECIDKKFGEDGGKYYILTDENGNKIRNDEDSTYWWAYDMIESHSDWFLNPNSPIGGPFCGDHGGYNGGAAYFYDFGADPEAMSDYFVDMIVRTVEKTGYSGIFIDFCSTGYMLPDGYCGFIPKRIQDMIKERYNLTNNRESYNKCNELAGKFWTIVRNKLPKEIKIFSNQSFYGYEYFYPAVDYDITESMFVSFVFGNKPRKIITADGPVVTSQTYYRGFNFSVSESDFTEALGDALGQNIPKVLEIVEVPLSQRENYNTEFFFVDYILPRYIDSGTRSKEGEIVYNAEIDRPAIFYAISCFKLLNCEGSLSDWYADGNKKGRYYQDDMYFVDLGKPLDENFSYRKADGNLSSESSSADYAIRYFENGFVLVSTDIIKEISEFKIGNSLVPKGIKGLYDMYERNFLPGSGDSVKVYPVRYDMYKDDIANGFRQAGRIFMYIN